MQRFSFYICGNCGDIPELEEAPDKCAVCKRKGSVTQKFSDEQPMKRSEFVDFLSRRTIVLAKEPPETIVSRLVATIAGGLQDDN